MTSAVAILALVFLGSSPPTVLPGSRLEQEIDIIEKLGDPLPLELTFRDQAGEQKKLGDYFTSERPKLLTLVYYRCPMLCDLVLSGVARAVRQSGMKLGEDFDAVTLSVDPTDTPKDAAGRQMRHLQALGQAQRGASWTFLTGDDGSIRSLADAVGFRYAFDASSKQYAHAAAVFVLSPSGKISRYLYGVDFSARDLRLALVEASGGRIGTSFDRILLRCFKYDPASKRYRWYIAGVIQGGGLLVFATLAGLLGVLWRRELRRRAQ